ncbi:WW domain-binding protein 11-like [Zerene cesonia]|uniref:WW domain-binding protein 11-like n=1 Tax=Zerene cesonia TaxID=33412 RepID=UPI0018E59CFE|nr:WW domain-binding protein 11-like [Zerene cesonia]
MQAETKSVIVYFMLSVVIAKDPELPLCPTNIQYFPQNLPMHCRMPTPTDMQNIPNLQMPFQSPTLPPFPPPFYQSPPPGKQPEPMPLPVPPGMPGIPAMPGPMPIPMPMPLPGPPGPAHKLPVIVMPFYSPDNSFKKPQQGRPDPRPRPRIRIRKRRPRYYSDTDDSSDTDTDTSSNELTDSTSEYDGFWRGKRSGRRSNRHHREKRRRHQRQELLTPVLQYVTKDGYVIFEKKITKGEAKDWLKVKTDNFESTTHAKQVIEEFEDVEEAIQADKEDEKVEIKTERNTQKHHRRKSKHKLPKNGVAE